MGNRKLETTHQSNDMIFTSMDVVGVYLTTGSLPAYVNLTSEHATTTTTTATTTAAAAAATDSTLSGAVTSEIILLQHQHIKSIMEIVGSFLESSLFFANFSQYKSFLPWLLSLTLSGVAECAFDSTLSKNLSDMALLVCNNVKQATVGGSGGVCYNTSDCTVTATTNCTDSVGCVDIVTALMRVCQLHMHYTSSIHVRKTAIAGFIALFVSNMHLLDSAVRKDFKNSLMLCVGINTPTGIKAKTTVVSYSGSNSTPDIVGLVQYGLVGYMVTKPTCELNTLASAYIKNLQLLYDNIRRQRNSGADVLVDNTLLTTVISSCSLVMIVPLDVPHYLPPLLEKLLQLCTISHSTSGNTTTAASSGTIAVNGSSGSGSGSGSGSNDF